MLQGEDIIRNEDIIELINQSGYEIALILFSGVQYYTGQFFDVLAITKIGQSKVYVFIIHFLKFYILLFARDVLLDGIWLTLLAMFHYICTNGMSILQRGVLTNI